MISISLCLLIINTVMLTTILVAGFVVRGICIDLGFSVTETDWSCLYTFVLTVISLILYEFKSLPFVLFCLISCSILLGFEIGKRCQNFEYAYFILPIVTYICQLLSIVRLT